MRWAALAVAVVLGVVWVRAAVSARSELALGRAAEAAGDVEAALMRYQFALRWYTPGASAPAEAAERLDALAAAAEAAGDRATARAALERLRGGIRAVRSFYSPFGDRAGDVDRRLAALLAAEAAELPYTAGRSRAELEAEHAALLALDPVPATGWTLAVLLGFVGWVAGAFVTIARGLDAQARLQRGPALRWGGVTLVCFVVWLVGLANA